jgi:membrane protein
MKTLYHRLHRATLRVIPDCVSQSQAVAFNMFLSFFPMLLIVLSGAIGSRPLRQAVVGMADRLRLVLPPGIAGILDNFLLQHSGHPWRLLVLGLSGTLLAGVQMMKLIMEGFATVFGDLQREKFWARTARAVALLSATIMPSVLTMNLIVFGRQLRGWFLNTSSMPVLYRFVGTTLYVMAALLIALLVVSIIYRVGRPAPQPWMSVVPGAMVATLLWWVISAALGFYLRHVPYSLVYGGLAVTIGFLLWMQLTATILLIGAAFNAELQQSRLTISSVKA